MSPDDQGRLRNTIYRTTTRSGRRMTPARRALYAIAVPLAVGLIHLWWRLCRVVRIEGIEHLDGALARAPSLIPCYWHQHQLYCGKFLVEQRARNLTPGWLISPSVDGELGAMMVRRFGGAVIRGSSTHTGARALRDYYQALVRENVSPVITPDGPRGPRFKFKPGALLLAQMSGRPILPMSYAASRAWLIKWDRFVIPMPFARIVIAIGPPRYVPRVTDAAALERLQAEMEAELPRLFQLAERSLRGAAEPEGPARQ
ncbi:MAG: lysophospholipid acyltransferase family protein [Gammaproteobacteria bacterium]|nr:lysophospholipid acyltransferase family protein [Gammaproteobacteria bacterium]MBV8306794.1 lysophospholipid acyltransferase family protein [Gammaproteobacteria bacterium]